MRLDFDNSNHLFLRVTISKSLKKRPNNPQSKNFYGISLQCYCGIFTVKFLFLVAREAALIKTNKHTTNLYVHKTKYLCQLYFLSSLIRTLK